MAARYLQGRVLLAGDAGHVTMPIGGQGMNAGIHDAVGLAWRLAMMVAGQAQQVVLESYDQERHGEHARLDRQQATGFRRTVERGRATDLALNLAAQLLPGIGSLIQGTDDLHQMSVHYSASGLNDDRLGSPLLNRRTPRAGDRAPDAPVVDEHGTTTLFAHTTNPDGVTWGWSLLAFDGGKDDPRGHRAAAIAAVGPWPSVRPRLISAASASSDPAALATDLADLDQRAHAAYGLRGRPALVLVRPDGHIAFRGAADHPELLRSYCTRVFGPPAAGAA